MLTPLLAGLTKEQKHALADLGIPHSRISEWKSGKRKPTLAQILVLAMVTNADPKPLVTWLAEQEANPAQLDMFRQVQKRGSWALLTALFAVGLLAPDSSFAQCSSSQTRFDPQGVAMHIVDMIRKLRRALITYVSDRLGGLFFGLDVPKTAGC